MAGYIVHLPMAAWLLPLKLDRCCSTTLRLGLWIPLSRLASMVWFWLMLWMTGIMRLMGSWCGRMWGLFALVSCMKTRPGSSPCYPWCQHDPLGTCWLQMVVLSCTVTVTTSVCVVSLAPVVSQISSVEWYYWELQWDNLEVCRNRWEMMVFRVEQSLKLNI